MAMRSSPKLFALLSISAVMSIAVALHSHAYGQASDPAQTKPAEVPIIGPKAFIDYFKPTPVKGRLSKTVWGAKDVGPRDTRNGLEDASLTEWNYWDGQILRGADGKYRMFASRWDQALGHDAWKKSLAVRAISDAATGPYRDMGLTWPDDQGGLGHNVTALRLPAGQYAIVVSETRNGDVFTSDSIDGPWKRLGSITVDQSRYKSLKTPGDTQESTQLKPWKASNVGIIARPDGKFEIIQRSGQILISSNGILGPYAVMGDSIYRNLPGLPQNDMRAYEDPAVWYSGGWYHVLVNHWRDRRAYHLISRDGVVGWKVQGLAYEPGADFIRYTNGTVNNWYKLERPGVLIEKGHVTALTFAVVDIVKEQQQGNDGHGSKVIVVPFDGAAMDRDLADIDKRAGS
ncbi:glycoside hydrolase family protein [Sphingobium lactosutens]|uniref:glycoside hydrolase family protein n=1 Tax=Sphingobium lactosutens TaxID=522773 RepID=UPI0015BA9E67|nr:glycoside hydrolase family protein [Sphingobium lactosutens]